MEYCTTCTIEADFETVVDRVEAALSEEGFGVLSEIDVDEAFADKLGLTDYPRYRILGACNPSLAKDALDIEPNLGVLLPCNIVVRETADGTVTVAAVEPEAMLSVADAPDLNPIAAEVAERIDRVCDELVAPAP